MKAFLFLAFISFMLSCGGVVSNDCDSLCKKWEVYNIEKNSCSLSVGRCGVTADCNGNLICEDHLCVKAPKCDPICKEWETCKTDNRCEISSGRCTKQEDCEDGFLCDVDSYNCYKE